MDLIKRYLHAVKGHLPVKQQDDVIAELPTTFARASTTGKPSWAGRSMKTRSWPSSGSLGTRRTWPPGTDRGSS